MRKTVAYAVAVFGVLALTLSVLQAAHCATETLTRADSSESADADEVPSSSDVGSLSPDSWEPPVFDGRVLTATVADEGQRVNCIIGVAGLYPPIEASGEQVPLPEAVSDLPFEVWCATQSDAFWDTVPAATASIELTPSALLVVSVEGPDGSDFFGANVRLARGPVALVVRTAQTDTSGSTVFRGTPPGTYHLTVEAPGFLGFTVEITQTMGGSSVVARLERGHQVTGTVRDPRGRPIGGALVAIHVEAEGNTLPERVVPTNPMGEFIVDGLRPGVTWAVAVAEGWAPGTSPRIDTMTNVEPVVLDVELVEGRRVNVRVTDADNRPVPGAAVTWTDPASSLGETRLVGRDGFATISGLTPTARLVAQFADWKSSVVELQAVRGDEVRLVLERFDASRQWRVRFETPPTVEVTFVEAHDARGVRCAIEALDGRDYILRGCGPGTLSVQIETNRGSLTRSWEAKDGMTVVLPEPTPVKLELVGAEGQPATAELASESTQIPLEPASTWVTAVYPGRWTLLTEIEGVLRQFVVEVGASPVDRKLEIVSDRTLSVWVVDRWNAPINQAWVMLTDDESRIVGIARSGGQLPATFRVTPPFQGRVIAVDPRRGEGARTIEVSSDEKAETRIVLDGEVLSADVPRNRLDRPSLSSALGARLVDFDEGWRLDFERTDAPGLAAGLKRGDRIVSAWPIAGALQVVVFRDGEGYLDITLPR